MVPGTTLPVPAPAVWSRRRVLGTVDTAVAQPIVVVDFHSSCAAVPGHVACGVLQHYQYIVAGVLLVFC